MKTESIAVLRWIPSETLLAGEEAVVAVLEEALSEAAAGAGMQASGTMQIRQVSVSEYPYAMAGQPKDDPGALLHLAELIFD